MDELIETQGEVRLLCREPRAYGAGHCAIRATRTPITRLPN